MRILEIVSEAFRGDWRQALRGRENTPLHTNPDHESPEFDDSDTLDISQTPVQATKRKTSKAKTTQSQEQGGNTIDSALYPNTNQQNKEVITKIFNQGQQLGYDVQAIKHHNYGLSLNATSKSNGIPVGIALGTTSGKLPNAIRVGIGSSSAGEEKRAEIYRSLAEKFNLPEDIFDGTKKEGEKIGKTYWRDGLTPSFRLNEMGAQTTDQIAKTFWDIVQFVDSMGSDFNIPRGSRSSSGARGMIEQTKSTRMYYQKLTYNLIDTWHSGQPWALSRGGEGGAFDQYDSLITIGYTREGYTNSRSGSPTQREHVVPCDYINMLGIQVCDKNLGNYRKMRPDKVREKFPAEYNKTVREVADIIQRNLAIVISSEAESDYIDYKMGWQTKMPEGWKDGDNILARFIQCVGYPNKDSKGIPVYAKSSGKRLAEETT